MNNKSYKALLLSLMAACALSMPVMAGETEADASSVPTEDRAGNAISVPDEVSSIISMAPSTTQFLIDLGLADSIIACDTYSYDAFSDSLPADIPQYDMMSPDNESLIALQPDIIFTTGMSYVGGDDVYAAVREAGLCIADIPSSESLADIEEDLLFIGSCVGKYDESAAIADEMETMKAELSELGSAIAEEDKKTVLYELSTPTADYPTIYTTGTGTYIDELINLIGAVNVCADQTSWATLSEEAAIALNPDVIITADTYTPDVVDTLLNLEGWETVTAVSGKQVYQLALADTMSRPNQHVFSAALEMAADIYPEIFADIEDPFAAGTAAAESASTEAETAALDEAA